MNARQKAKFYKRKYEELLHMPISKTIVETRKVNTLRYEKYIPEKYMSYGNIYSYLFIDMTNSLSEEIRKHCEWYIEHIPEKSMFKFTAQLKLIDPGVQEELEYGKSI